MTVHTRFVLPRMIVVIVASYLLATLVVGAALSSRIRRVSDFLVAGRNLGLALTALVGAAGAGATGYRDRFATKQCCLVRDSPRRPFRLPPPG